MGLTGALQGTLRGPTLKFMFYELLIKLYVRGNNLCIAYLFLLQEKNILKCFKWGGGPARRLQVPVAGYLRDQAIRHSRDARGTLVKMFFKFFLKLF